MKKGATRAEALFAILEKRPESLIPQGPNATRGDMRSDASITHWARPAKTRASSSARGSR
jgi:hypothetical protein